MRRFYCLLFLLPLAAANADDAAPFIIVESAPANAASTIDPSKATGPVRVIPRSEYENRTANLADVLSNQTGVQIRQSGGLGSYSSVSIRGSTARQVQVVVDGMLLNDPVTGGVDMGKLGLHDISRIQVYPGGAPAQFAQAGIGGVVVMETLGKDIEDTTRINLGAGSFDTYKMGLFNSGSHEDFYYWVSLDRQSSNNDFEYPNSREWFNPNDGATTKRRNADYEQDAVSTKLGWEINNTSKLDALIQYNDNEQGVPSIQNWQNNKAFLANDTLRTQLHYQQQGWMDGQAHSSHRVIWSDANERYNNRTGLVGLGTTDVYTRTKQLGMANTVTWLLGNHTLSAAIDVAKYDYRQNDKLSSDLPDERGRLQIASALSHQWLSSNNRWRSQVSLRQYRIDDDSDEALGNGTVTQTSSTNRYNSWQLGLSHYFAGNWEVSGALSRQVRVPTLQELYGQQGLFVGNPDLEAEESKNYEITLRTDRGWGHAELTGFYRELDPAVAAIYDARGVGRYTNLSAEIYGAEIDALWRIYHWWELYGNVTLQESENTDDSVRDRFEQRLPGIYHESFVAGSRWHIRPLRFDVSYNYDDKLYYDAANRLMADPRTLVNASASWTKIWPNRSESEITLELQNITDEIYQDFSRFPGPGRSWFVNVKHIF
ncbi:TonB-dependent receptor [uncultured Marinobacter sp.]|uniref:TonB-dependent receptor n=1 Tax=uncultured Marinobacter sp. TaxID=187379 RepID=UPI00260DFFC5|nr:TonB-dependent receptor [uncultured Marinobacter sp.]